MPAKLTKQKTFSKKKAEDDLSPFFHDADFAMLLSHYSYTIYPCTYSIIRHRPRYIDSATISTQRNLTRWNHLPGITCLNVKEILPSFIFGSFGISCCILGLQYLVIGSRVCVSAHLPVQLCISLHHQQTPIPQFPLLHRSCSPFPRTHYKCSLSSEAQTHDHLSRPSQTPDTCCFGNTARSPYCAWYRCASRYTRSRPRIGST